MIFRLGALIPLRSYVSHLYQQLSFVIKKNMGMTSPSENDFMESKFRAFFRYAMVIGCLLGKCLHLRHFFLKFHATTSENISSQRGGTHTEPSSHSQGTVNQHTMRHLFPNGWPIGLRVYGLNTRNGLKPLVKITRIEILQKQHMSHV